MNEPMHYEIHVAQQLDDDRWSVWFGGLTLTPGEDNTTFLHGPLVDQAALYGLLEKTRDLGLTLLSLQRLDPPPAHQPQVEPQD